jgi:molecular chaperone DnaK (HSP70)
MAGRLDEILTLDVVAHSYVVAVLAADADTPAGALPLLPSGPGEATVCRVALVKRNTTVPTKKKTTFACAEGQTAAFVQVFQGERARPADNVLIFALAFAVPSGAPGGVELEVDIDANDNAAVVATVLATGEKHKLQHVGEPNRPEEARMRLAALNEAEAVAEATARLRKRISEVEAHLDPFDSATDRAQAWLHESARGATLAEVETRRRVLDDDVRALARDLAARLGGTAAVGAGSGGATARPNRTSLRPVDSTPKHAAASSASPATITRRGPKRSSSQPPARAPPTPATMIRIPNTPSCSVPQPKTPAA